jgi:transcriptional regulator with XRE-family HTH domain
MSTIAKHREAANGSPFAEALGQELRLRRVALGLSQTTVGEPLSRAFLSSVESGRVVPSLPSLLMIARRLNTTAAAILAAVDRHLEADTDRDDANQATIARPG